MSYAWLMTKDDRFEVGSLEVSCREDMDRRLLELEDYRCPFSLIDQFDQWFEWHRRVHFDRESTGKVTVAMVEDIRSLRKWRVDRVRCYVSPDFVAKAMDQRFLIRGYAS